MRVIPTFCAITQERMVCPVLSLKLDLDVDAGRQVELHERIDCLRRGIDDVEQALVRAHLKLLAALLVDVRRAVDGEALDARRQRNRPAHLRAGALGRVDDLARGRIEHAMVERLEADSYVLTLHDTRCRWSKRPLLNTRSARL